MSRPVPSSTLLIENYFGVWCRKGQGTALTTVNTVLISVNLVCFKKSSYVFISLFVLQLEKVNEGHRNYFNVTELKI